VKFELFGGHNVRRISNQKRVKGKIDPRLLVRKGIDVNGWVLGVD